MLNGFSVAQKWEGGQKRNRNGSWGSLLFYDRVSLCSLGWTRTQDGPETELILQPLLHNCYNDNCLPHAQPFSGFDPYVRMTCAEMGRGAYGGGKKKA